MPKLQRPIPESDQAIVRPIVIGLIQEVLIDRMALPSDMQINYPGYTEAVPQPHGFISNKYEPNRFPTSDKIKVEVTENYVEDWLPSVATNTPEQIPLFLNRDLEVEMRPIYSSMELRFAITYRAKGKTDARRFYDRMMLNIPNREDTWLHTLNFHFSMPAAFEVILKEIHRMTEAVDGYGDDWDTFLAKWVNPRYGRLTDQAGKNTLGVFSETQQRCIGFWDLSTVPDFGGKQNETDIWEIEIPYVLRYEKPKDVYLSYPIVIHNQVVKYREKAGFQRLSDHQTTRTWSMKHLQSFEAMENVGKRDSDFPGRYFPLFDEFMPRMVAENTKRVFTTLVLLDTDPTSADPLKLMNVLDLEEEQFGMILSPCIKEFMASEREFITKARRSALHLGLYMGRELMDPKFIEMDEDLNIRLTQPMPLRRYYHIRFGLTTDLTYIDPAAQARLRAKPCAMEHIIDYILPEGKPRPVPDVAGGVVTEPSYEDISETLKGRRRTRGMKTVQFTNLNALYNMRK